MPPTVHFLGVVMDDKKFKEMLEETSIVVRKSFEEDWEIIKSEASIYQIDIPSTLDPFDVSSIKVFMELLSPQDSYMRYKLKIHVDLVSLFKKTQIL